MLISQNPRCPVPPKPCDLYKTNCGAMSPWHATSNQIFFLCFCRYRLVLHTVGSRLRSLSISRHRSFLSERLVRSKPGVLSIFNFQKKPIGCRESQSRWSISLMTVARGGHRQIKLKRRVPTPSPPASSIRYMCTVRGTYLLHAVSFCKCSHAPMHGCTRALLLWLFPLLYFSLYHIISDI
jgi:hypothetical protein